MALSFNPYEAPERRDPSTQLAMHLPAGLLRGGEDFVRALIERAVQAERKGAKATDIFHDTARRVQDQQNETGIFRSPEGTWNFELSDANARIDPAFNQDFFPHYDPVEGGSAGYKSPLNVSAFYDNPELIDRIPSLGGIKLQVHQPEYGPNDAASLGTAAYHHMDTANPNGLIELRGQTGYQDVNDPGEGSLLDLLTHEIQHGVQDRYTMPRGGMPGDDTAVWGRPAYRQGGRELHTRFSAEVEDFARRYERDGLGSLAEGVQVWEELNPYAKMMKDVGFEQGGRAGSFQPSRREIPPSWTSFQDYMGLAGETQARQAAARKFMTVPQRLEVPPFLPDQAGGVLPQPNQMLRFGDTQFGLAGAFNDPSIERLLREQRYGP